MFIIFIIIIELLFLYLLSRSIFLLLYTLFYLPLKNQNISKYLVTLLFLPGIIFHEFSHALVARLLGVKVGQIMLYPYKDKETGELKTGSCEIEQVDPFRMSLIGIAPTLLGLIILSLLVFYIFSYTLPLGDLMQIPQVFLEPRNYLPLLGIFITSTTMFTSKKDLKDFLMVAPVVALFIFLLYYAGFRISLSSGLIDFLKGPLTSLAFVLGFTLIIDLLIYIFLFIPISLIITLINRTKNN